VAEEKRPEVFQVGPDGTNLFILGEAVFGQFPG
jgi:hypothetical protein